MPYSNKADVEFYGQFTSSDFGASGYNYDNSIAKAITDADGMIDEYCNVPKDFFVPGGIEIVNEYLDGVDVAYLGGITHTFNWYYGGINHLTVKYRPVLSVTKFEEETSAGSWTTRTEGSGNDYIVMEDGVRFITNTPMRKYKNVRATYKAGYATTPTNISQVSAQLAAAILQNIIDRNTREPVTVAGQTVGVSSLLKEPVFSEEMKRKLQSYRRVIYSFV